MEMATFEARFDELEAEIGTLMGVINAAHGRLVELVGEALDDDLWAVSGIHSPAHWLAWQGGLGAGRARNIVRIAERREELPTATAALVSGELSVDAVIEIARHAPATHEASITAFAHDATVPQLRRCLRTYAYDAAAPGTASEGDGASAEADGASAEGDGTGADSAEQPTPTAQPADSADAPSDLADATNPAGPASSTDTANPDADPSDEAGSGSGTDDADGAGPDGSEPPPGEGAAGAGGDRPLWPRPKGVEEQRSVSMGGDERRWWLNAGLPLDEGAVVQAALKAARDDLYRQRRAADPDGPPPVVTWADALLAIAEAS
ncbi:MAG TPA: DUF222 domain-containing protein, partial [Aquihabitans sp.]|nr:DUF222 domain-containing protein [Aquihabitans sp.]